MNEPQPTGNGNNGSFDWAFARRKLEALTQRLGDGAENPRDDKMDEILKQRAAQFAKVPTQDEEGARVDLTVIRLRTELYGIDARFVSRIRPATQVAPVPRVPAWVRGLTNERGRILSVLDLASFLALGRPGSSTGEETAQSQALLTIETPHMELALLADEVLNVISIPVSHIHEASDVARGIPKEYVCGVVNHQALTERLDLGSQDGDEVTLLVLDLQALLSDERLIVEETIA